MSEPKAPYVFQEFPKWIKHPATGKDVLVQNAAEEEEVLGTKPVKSSAPVVEVESNKLVSEDPDPVDEQPEEKVEETDEATPRKKKKRKSRG